MMDTGQGKIEKKKKSQRYYTAREQFAFFSCAFLILWGPLYAYYLHFDGKGIAAITMLISACMVNYRFIKRFSFNRTYVIYCILALYMMINGLLKGGQNAYEKDGIYQLCRAALAAPLMMMILTPLLVKYFDKTIKYLVYTLWIYSVMYALNSSFEDISDVDRLTGDINANEAVLYIVACIICQIVQYVRHHMSFIRLVVQTIPLLVIIICTGSRMGITMSFIVIIFTMFTSIDLRKSKNKFTLILLLLIVGVMSYYVLNNTVVGTRLQGESDDLVDRETTGTALDVIGDRGLAYYNSWSYFLENPVTGIGFENWFVENPLEIRAHSEYMVMYVENGIIAFVLYICFLVLIFKRLHHYIHKHRSDVRNKRTAYVLLFSMISIVYADIVLWTHNEYPVFVIYAMCVALSQYNLGVKERIVSKQLRCNSLNQKSEYSVYAIKKFNESIFNQKKKKVGSPECYNYRKCTT